MTPSPVLSRSASAAAFALVPAPRLPAGGGVTIEVPGHGMDLTRDFSFDGGPGNIGGGCGAIGSVKPHLALSRANPASAGTAERAFTLR